jgi:hypothetical protein
MFRSMVPLAVSRLWANAFVEVFDERNRFEELSSAHWLPFMSVKPPEILPGAAEAATGPPVGV